MKKSNIFIGMNLNNIIKYINYLLAVLSKRKINNQFNEEVLLNYLLLEKYDISISQYYNDLIKKLTLLDIIEESNGYYNPMNFQCKKYKINFHSLCNAIILLSIINNSHYLFDRLNILSLSNCYNVPLNCKCFFNAYFQKDIRYFTDKIILSNGYALLPIKNKYDNQFELIRVTRKKDFSNTFDFEENTRKINSENVLELFANNYLIDMYVINKKIEKEKMKDFRVICQDKVTNSVLFTSPKMTFNKCFNKIRKDFSDFVNGCILKIVDDSTNSNNNIDTKFLFSLSDSEVVIGLN